MVSPLFLRLFAKPCAVPMNIFKALAIRTRDLMYLTQFKVWRTNVPYKFLINSYPFVNLSHASSLKWVIINLHFKMWHYNFRIIYYYYGTSFRRSFVFNSQIRTTLYNCKIQVRSQIAQKKKKKFNDVLTHKKKRTLFILWLHNDRAPTYFVYNTCAYYGTTKGIAIIHLCCGSHCKECEPEGQYYISSST